MPQLLVIHASPRGEYSISRKLGERYIHHWTRKHPDGVVVVRDITDPPTPYMNEDWTKGVYAPPEVVRTPEMLSALALSKTLIEEVIASDEILICTPMYNFTFSAALKSWIDYIVRPGFTFKRAADWVPLLTDKARPTRVLVATRDVHDADGDDDQVTPVIRRIFRFMGMTDVGSLLVGGSIGVNRGLVSVEDHVAKFEQQIAQLVA